MNRTGSDEELRQYGVEFTTNLKPHSVCATVVTLSGELGAGKTTFVQAIAKTLGVQETVTSPTFVLEKIYHLPAQAGLEGQPFDSAQGKKFSRLVHIDAYRLKGAHELEALGWEELLADPANLIVLEWPERIEAAIPKDALRIKFDIVSDGRIITIDGKKEG